MITTDLSVRNADDDLFGNLFESLVVCPVGAGSGISTINTSTGAANPLGLSGRNGCCGNALAFSPADTLFFGDDADLYTVNQGKGDLTMIANMNYPADPLDDTPRTNAMDFEPGSGILFASIINGGGRFFGPRENFLGTVNTTTGDVAVIGETVECLDAIAFVPPEPPSGPIVIIPTMGQWGMIFAAIILGMFAVIRLRRKVSE